MNLAEILQVLQPFPKKIAQVIPIPTYSYYFDDDRVCFSDFIEAQTNPAFPTDHYQVPP